MGQTPKMFAQKQLTRAFQTVYTGAASVISDFVTDLTISNNTRIDNPLAPTITNGGTAGTTTYSYYVVANDAWGGKTLVGAVGTTTTGNATLSTTNYNTITWSAVVGAVSYDVLKTNTATSLALAVTGTTVNDTGQATATYTTPTSNTTGITAFVTIHHVPSGGTVGLGNRIGGYHQIDAGTTVDMQININLATGDTLQAKVNSSVNADTAIDNNVTVELNGVEFS